MLRLFFLFLAIFVASCFHPVVNSGLGAYSYDSREVEIQFHTYVDIEDSKFEIDFSKLPIGSEISLDQLDPNIITKYITQQVLHTYGAFSEHPLPTNFAYYPGVMSQKYKTEPIRASIFDRSTLRIEYKFSGVAAFYRELLSEQDVNRIEFFLPTKPFSIYYESFPDKPAIDPDSGKSINPCTKRDDNGINSFWYYWNPYKKGCPNKIFSRIHIVDALLTTRKFTQQSFPEFERLYAGGKPIVITWFFGSDGPAFDRNGSVIDKTDVGYRVFKASYEYLTKVTKPYITGSNIGDHEASVNIVRANSAASIKMYFLDPERKSFINKAKQAFFESDVILYSGHSDLGGFFDPKRIFAEPKSGLPKDKYQIFYSNSCNSYSYFYESYFALKKSRSDPLGIKNLDIVGNAIGAGFDLSDTNLRNTHLKKPTGDIILALSLLGLNGDGNPRVKVPSWQRILTDIAISAGYDETSMTILLGDEDNSKVSDDFSF